MTKRDARDLAIHDEPKVVCTRVHHVKASADQVAGSSSFDAERDGIARGELAHRLKNHCAVVRALVELSLRHVGSDLSCLPAVLRARLDAIDRINQLLDPVDMRDVDLAEIVNLVLAPWRDVPGERIFIHGQRSIQLTARQARAIAMGLNELATNAAKHGALTATAGQVSVRWTDETSGTVALEWTETGGPPLPGPPGRSGFGMRLLQHGLATDLGDGASVAVNFEPGGLRALLRLPHAAH